MAAVVEWTGREIRALREAMRMTVRAFAEQLGVSERMVSKWLGRGEAISPRAPIQAALDAMLATADATVRARFERLVGGAVVPVETLTLTAAAQLVVRHPVDGKLMTLIEEGPYEPPTGDRVWLAGYLIDVHPTTCDDYRRFTEETDYGRPAAWPGGSAPARVARLDAQAYCAWAAKSLPTQVQLHRAAGGAEGVVALRGGEWCALNPHTSRRGRWPKGPASFRTAVPVADLLAMLTI